MFIEPTLLISAALPLTATPTPESAASQGRSLVAEVLEMWPVLLVALGLAIVLATAWKWWSSRRAEPAKDTNHTASADNLRQIAHQVAEDLDAKADRLAMLIKHADRRIKALSELTEGIADDDGKPEVVTRAGRREPVRTAPADPIAEQVYQMADAGLTAVQIAQKLSQPTGNVELMLALRR